MSRRNRKRGKGNEALPRSEESLKAHMRDVHRKTIHSYPNTVASFSKMNQGELLSILAGLSIIPENQNHSFGLIVALRLAGSVKNNNIKTPLVMNEVDRILNDELLLKSPVSYLEDPPEDVFTDNIEFIDGNFVIYTGGGSGEAFILSNLLRSIFSQRDSFSKEFINGVGAASASLLSISNEIARRAGHYRYMDGKDGFSNRIAIPNDEKLRKLVFAVTFSDSEINGLLKEKGLSIASLKPFIKKAGGKVFDEKDPDLNPLLTSPIIEFEGRYIVNPSTIAISLIHFIILFSILSKQNKQLSNLYQRLLMHQAINTLLGIGLVLLDGSLLEDGASSKIKEELLQFDTDKIAYVQLISDDFSKFNPITPVSEWDNRALINQMDARERQVFQKLKNDADLRERQILTLRLIGTTVRSCILSSKRSHALSFSVDDLLTIANLPEFDELSLWKYAQSLYQLTTEKNVLSFSSLDIFSLYYYNWKTFQYGQVNIDSGWVPPGFSRALKVKVRRETDGHGVPRGNPLRLISVELYNRGTESAVYVPERRFGTCIGLLIKGYYQPIWVSIVDEPYNNEYGVEFCLHYLEHVVGWLLLVKPELSKFLAQLGDLPIEILLSPNSFNKLFIKKPDDDQADTNDIEITVVIEHDTNKIQYASKFIHAPEDNINERRFLFDLLRQLGKLVAKVCQNNSLNETECLKIVDQHLPRGESRASVSVPNIGYTSLNRKGLVPLRRVQLPDLVAANGDFCLNDNHGFFIDHTYTDPGETNKICRKAVDFFHQKLKTILSQFSHHSLLMTLLENNEAVCHRRAEASYIIQQGNLPNEEQNNNFEKQLKELPELDRTAMATRTLIEMIAAEPTDGDKEVSNAELDTLLALADQLITWANISDQIHLGISKPEITFFENGRIEIQNSSITEVWNLFRRKMIIENVEIIDVDEKLIFRRFNADILTDQEREEAYLDEFGISLSQMGEFFGYLSALGFNDEIKIPMDLDALKEKILNDLNFSTADINSIFDNFSLVSRDKWEKPPDGFKDGDIMPWRFNRRLSYLRRPLVVSVKSDGSEVVFWGPRHTTEALKQLIYQIETGRFVSKSNQSRMSSLTGKIVDEAGTIFTNQVKKYLDGYQSLKVEKEIDIGPSGHLYFEKKLGDIDVLAVDPDRHLMFLLECKNIHPSRNPHEIYQEIERFFIKDGNKESWMDKHMKRTEWVISHMSSVLKLFKLDVTEYDVCSMFITSIEIPSIYFRDTPLPFIPYSSLLRNGLSALDSRYE